MGAGQTETANRNSRPITLGIIKFEHTFRTYSLQLHRARDAAVVCAETGADV